MTRYIIRRLLWGVVLLVLVSALTFVIFRILPTADPAKLRAGRLQNPKIIAEIRQNLGLDKPLLTQFWLYMKGIFLHFDLGFSYYSNAPVKTLIFERIPATRLARARRRGRMAGGRPVGRDRLGAAPALAPRPRSDGHGAGARVGAGILAWPDRAVPVRDGHRAACTCSPARAATWR